MSDRPNCYKCKHRGTLPGDAHSQCEHPDIEKTFNFDWFEGLAQAYIGKAGPAKRALGIVGGGQTWPANFNPAFLTACNGFEAKSSGPEK